MKPDSLTIRFVDETEIPALFPIFTVINPSNDAETLREMFGQGYRCAVAFEKWKYIGVLGVWIVTKFYIGKHVEYDHFFVRQQGCVAAELSCGINEVSSRELWAHLGFGVAGYRYRKRYG